MKVFKSCTLCLFLILRCIFCKDVSVKWMRLDTGNTYGSSTAVEGQLSTHQCLVKCLGIKECQSVNVHRESQQCEVSVEHPLDKTVIPSQRPGWIVFYRDRRNCKDVLDRGDTTTGFKFIFPDGINEVRALCEMDTDGGGWTVVQKRESYSDFYKGWQEYRNGFGDDLNHWIGLENIYRLTSKGNYTLRIDMKRVGNIHGAVQYQTFAVGSESELYKLTIGNYSNVPTSTNPVDPTDCMIYPHNGMNFTTYDRDNDRRPTGNCASELQGGYWYDGLQTCQLSHLNGVYGSTAYDTGMNWYRWTGSYESLIYSRMMIRPK